MPRYYLIFLLITGFQWSWKGHHRKETSELWLHQTWNHGGQISSWYDKPTLQNSQYTTLFTITFGSIDDYHKSDWRDIGRLKMACQSGVRPIDGTLASWGRLGNWLHPYAVLNIMCLYSLYTRTAQCIWSNFSFKMGCQFPLVLSGWKQTIQAIV